jgi:nascent polypeptide-associated complex subunit alpha
MFPGLGGMNPKKMQAMMKQMGIDQDEIDATRVVIECSDRRIVIENPGVTKIDMKGQESFQITGEVTESPVGEGDATDAVEDLVEESEESDEEEEDNTEEDIKTIMEKIGCLEEEARMALEKADGDLTEALIELG